MESLGIKKEFNCLASVRVRVDRGERRQMNNTLSNQYYYVFCSNTGLET